ncbi:MAG: hypothetical protein JWN26_205 [Candidatus Saccharibacteria bacterium]|nr:hypothetical protein [Candidatus Saccharibacteria bacterium]
MLSSDILEQQFGPTKLVIVFQDFKHRIIQTITKQNHKVLELSLVTFDQSNVNTFAVIHQKILGGDSMGKTFKDADVNFVRDIHFINHEIIPSNIQATFDQVGQATIIDVDILVGPNLIHYCHITEIYSPSVVWPKSNHPALPTIKQTLAEFSKLLSLV